MIKEYELLDPDNQDKSQDYYSGVRDTADLIGCMLADICRLGEGPEELKALVDQLELLVCDMDERRRSWYMEHIGIRPNPKRRE